MDTELVTGYILYGVFRTLWTHEETVTDLEKHMLTELIYSRYSTRQACL